MDSPSAELTAQSTLEAREAGLRYSSDEEPGIRREFSHGEPLYLDASGKRISDETILARIKHLVIPPAWKEVWICPSAKGHLQVTGRDVRGRKQYRYHEKWRQHRDETKFHRMLDFGAALPTIRRQVNGDLKRHGMPREKVLATLVRLLEVSLIRIGNDEYVRQNHSYGLTTLRNKHAKVSGSRIDFNFKGKSGVRHEISIRDSQLARIVHRCQDMPGQELFSYEDEDHRLHRITSQDVNDYLRDISGEEFTAKDFRTWAGTTLTAVALSAMGPGSHETQAKKNLRDAIESVSRTLGNTPTVCRKCYIHPAILETYLSGVVVIFKPRPPSRQSVRLKPEETAVIALLKKRLKAR